MSELVTIEVPTELHRKLEDIAALDGSGIPDLMLAATTEYVAGFEEELRKIASTKSEFREEHG